MRQDQQNEAETSQLKKRIVTLFQLPIPTISEVRYPWTFHIYEQNFLFLL